MFLFSTTIIIYLNLQHAINILLCVFSLLEITSKIMECVKVTNNNKKTAMRLLYTHKKSTIYEKKLEKNTKSPQPPLIFRVIHYFPTFIPI